MSAELRSYQENGYLVVPGAISRATCGDFGRAVVDEYNRLTAAGWKFADAGAMAGHLNFMMGFAGRALLDAVKAAGIPQLVAELAGEPVFLDQAVGNLNLPGSRAQDFHMDGSFERPILISNICLVPTDTRNGATSVIPCSNREKLTYWGLTRGHWRRQARQPALEPGDILIRPSNLWHRGTPNLTDSLRPMAAFSWLPASLGGVADRTDDLDRPTTIFGNKFYGRFKRAKEFSAVYLPLIDEGLRLGRSLLQELRARAQ